MCTLLSADQTVWSYCVGTEATSALLGVAVLGCSASEQCMGCTDIALVCQSPLVAGQAKSSNCHHDSPNEHGTARGQASIIKESSLMWWQHSNQCNRTEATSVNGATLTANENDITLAIESTPIDNDESLGSAVVTTQVEVSTTSSNTDGTHDGLFLDFLLQATCCAKFLEDSLWHTDLVCLLWGWGGTVIKSCTLLCAVGEGTEATTVNGCCDNTSIVSVSIGEEASRICPEFVLYMVLGAKTRTVSSEGPVKGASCTDEGVVVVAWVSKVVSTSVAGAMVAEGDPECDDPACTSLFDGMQSVAGCTLRDSEIVCCNTGCKGSKFSAYRDHSHSEQDDHGT